MVGPRTRFLLLISTCEYAGTLGWLIADFALFAPHSEQRLLFKSFPQKFDAHAFSEFTRHLFVNAERPLPGTPDSNLAEWMRIATGWSPERQLSGPCRKGLFTQAFSGYGSR